MVCYTVILFYYYYLVCEAIGTAATPGLLCQPRVIVKMIMEKHMECRLAGETEVLGENLAQRHFCPSQYPTWPNPGRRGGKPATNRLTYGAALHRDNWISGYFATLLNLSSTNFLTYIFRKERRIIRRCHFVYVHVCVCCACVCVLTFWPVEQM
jgi:hypothetical protein